MKGTYRTYIEVIGPGVDLEVPVDIDYTITPYDPGRTYGPPEFCYPPEGGEIEVECKNSPFNKEITDAILNSDRLSEEIFEDVEGDLW